MILIEFTPCTFILLPRAGGALPPYSGDFHFIYTSYPITLASDACKSEDVYLGPPLPREKGRTRAARRRVRCCRTAARWAQRHSALLTTNLKTFTSTTDEQTDVDNIENCCPIAYGYPPGTWIIQEKLSQLVGQLSGKKAAAEERLHSYETLSAALVQQTYKLKKMLDELGT